MAFHSWREPSLSIHSITAAGPSKTLIPSWATASLSIRIVPDQALDTMVESLEAHLQKSFSSLRTRNTMDVSISHTAAWWLGSLTSPYFTALAQAIESVWKIKPLFIREGGSIPSLPFLEEEFGAASVQFPMGMSSDSAHLPEERIRITNLEKGKDIVERWFTALSRLPREACNQQV
jgi:di- and tripeptidase